MYENAILCMYVLARISCIYDHLINKTPNQPNIHMLTIELSSFTSANIFGLSISYCSSYLYLDTIYKRTQI